MAGEGYSRWLIIAGCLFSQTTKDYKVHYQQQACCFYSFQCRSFRQIGCLNLPAPYEEIHIKGDLRGIQSALPDLVVPECPINHHHSSFPSPLFFFFWLVIPLWFTTFPTTQTPELVVGSLFSYFMLPSVGQRHLLTDTHRVCFPYSCLVLSMLANLISCVYDSTNLEPGVC